MPYTPQDGFPYYLHLGGDKDLLTLYTGEHTYELLHSISATTANYRYQADKWSVKQVIGHITDHERIKIFRAFLLSRQQEVQLWGYDQDALVGNSRFEALSLAELLTDYRNVRNASISFITSLSEQQLQTKGMARQYEITLADFLKTIIGHEIHHLNIIKAKYL